MLLNPALGVGNHFDLGRHPVVVKPAHPGQHHLANLVSRNVHPVLVRVLKLWAGYRQRIREFLLLTFKVNRRRQLEHAGAAQVQQPHVRELAAKGFHVLEGLRRLLNPRQPPDGAGEIARVEDVNHPVGREYLLHSEVRLCALGVLLVSIPHRLSILSNVDPRLMQVAGRLRRDVLGVKHLHLRLSAHHRLEGEA